MPANAGLNIVIRDEGSKLPNGGAVEVPKTPPQQTTGPTNATAEQEAEMAKPGASGNPPPKPGSAGDTGAPNTYKPDGPFTYSIEDVPPAGFPVDFSIGDGLPGSPGPPDDGAPDGGKPTTTGAAPIPVLVMNDPLRVSVVGPLPFAPPPSSQEIVDLELVDEEIIQAKSLEPDEQKDADKAGDKDDEATPMERLLWLLTPLVYGQQGRGSGGPLGAIEHGLGAVRGAALKFTGPAFGGMISTVGGAATSMAGGMAPGVMASAIGGAGGMLTGLGGLVTAAGPAGLAIAGLAAAASAAVLAVDRYAQVLNSAAEDLKNYSPDIQIAYDLNALRNEMRQLDRGAQFGEDLAGFVETKGEIERTFKDGWDEVLRVMIDIWTEFEPIIRETLHWTKFQISTVRKLNEVMEGHWLPGWLQLLLKVFTGMSEDTRKIVGIKELEQELKDAKEDPLAALFIEYGKSLPPGLFPAGGPPVMGGGAVPLGVP